MNISEYTSWPRREDSCETAPRNRSTGAQPWHLLNSGSMTVSHSAVLAPPSPPSALPASPRLAFRSGHIPAKLVLPRHLQCRRQGPSLAPRPHKWACWHPALWRPLTHTCLCPAHPCVVSLICLLPAASAPWTVVLRHLDLVPFAARVPPLGNCSRSLPGLPQEGPTVTLHCPLRVRFFADVFSKSLQTPSFLFFSTQHRTCHIKAANKSIR